MGIASQILGQEIGLAKRSVGLGLSGGKGVVQNFLGQVVDAVFNPLGTFNISDFRSQVDGLGGVLRTNMFQVEVNLPPFLAARSSITTRTLSFFCMATNLPGVNIAAKEIHRYGYGPLEKMPMSFDYADITLNFIADANGVILNFFHDWIRGIMEISSDHGPSTVPRSRPNRAASMYPYMVNYKKNYETEVSINVYDSTGSQIAFNVNLNKTFPIGIGDIYLNWGNLDQFMIIPVRFSFLDTSFSTNNSSTLGQLFSNGLSLVENYVGGQISTSVLSSAVSSTSNIIAENGSSLANQLNNNQGGFTSGGYTFGPQFTST